MSREVRLFVAMDLGVMDLGVMDLGVMDLGVMDLGVDVLFTPSMLF
jgi:hypothetical protein